MEKVTFYQYIVKYNNVVVKKSNLFSYPNEAIKACLEFFEENYKGETFKNNIDENHQIVISNVDKIKIIGNNEYLNNIEAYFFKLTQEPLNMY